jgi:hypothetical protein
MLNVQVAPQHQTAIKKCKKPENTKITVTENAQKLNVSEDSAYSVAHDSLGFT